MTDPIELVNQGGSTSVHIDVRIDENGDLLFSGQDIGEAPEEIFGDSDYEYWLTVPAKAKDKLLLALIEKLYAGNSSVISELRELMESAEIPCMLGKKFDDALALASELHRDQVRKDAPIPYISHLMAVAGIVLEANAYHPMDNLEDIAIGALLHDSIEDQGDKIGLDDIRERFGETVYRIVLECSDAVVTEEGQEKPPWRERKKAYLAKIASKSRETLLVSCADKLHNARCIMFDYDRIGDRVWHRFNAGKDGTVWYYKSLAEEFEKAWPDNPLLPDFQALVQRIVLATG
jgi:hypothetical protein